tara:strand:- start:32391 stop:34520 length:2130 start_codon:yes stop_codon:yes gene_type:complete
MRVAIRAATDSTQFKGTSYNISAVGMAVYFASDVELAVGSKLRVFSADLVDALATVIWKTDEPVTDHHGEEAMAVGIAFDANQQLTDLALAVADYRPSVLLVGQDDASCSIILNSLGETYHVYRASSGPEAISIIDRLEVAVLITELILPGMSGKLFLEQISKNFPGNKIVKLVLAEYTDQETVRDFVAEHSLFYFVRKPINEEDLMTVVGSAAAEHARRLSGRHAINNITVHQRILEHSGRLAIQRDLRNTTQVAMEAILGLVQADRAYCLSYDRYQQILWTKDNDGERRVPAGTGIVGFAARTGKIVKLAQAGESRYVPDSDDPKGSGTDRYLAVPVNSPDDEVLAILVAVRSSQFEPFSDQEVEVLRNLATQSASAFNRTIFQAHIDGVFSDNRTGGASADSGNTIFRSEAMEEYYGARRPGGVLRVSPRWTVGTFWVLCGIFVAALAFIVFGKVSDLAIGPAVVVVEGKTPLTVAAAGTVTAVHVKPGQQVSAGERLVDLDASNEDAELHRVDKEFKTQLARSLRDPKDEVASAALAALRAQRDLARARLEDRIVRAPESGVVGDVRITVGQVAKPGEPLISFVNENSEYSIVAMIDGEHRPLLAPGMPIKLEFVGYKYSYQTLYITSISEEVLGPQEARGYLGTSLAETMEIDRPVSVVRAKLSGGSFTSRGKTLKIHAGMLGNVEIAVRRRRIITLLTPGLSD